MEQTSPFPLCMGQMSPFLPCMGQKSLSLPCMEQTSPFFAMHGENTPLSPAGCSPSCGGARRRRGGCSPHLVPHHEVLGSTQKAKAHPNPSKDLQSGCCSPSPSHAAPPTPQTILVPRGGRQQRGASSSCLLGWAARQSWPQRWAGTARPPRTQHGTDEDVMQWNLLSFILLKKHQAREGFAAS